MILSSSLRVSVCVFWALLLLLGFIHVLCRCIFSRCWHHRPSRKWKCQKCGDDCWWFFFFLFFAPVSILLSCMWLSMSYVRRFISGFVCFSCRVLSTEPAFRVLKLGLNILFDVCDSVACWRMRLCSLCMPSLHCQWVCTFYVLTV